MNMIISYPEKNLPTIAIVGRTNVGKSTLFNCLVEKSKAIISPIPGTTRTSNTATFLWRGQKYRLIDTGGFDFEKRRPYEQEIQKQIAVAFQEAQAVIFLIDLQSGLLPQDRRWARQLQKLERPIFLAGNKADSPKIRQNIYEPEWLKLGFGKPHPISAVNGSGVGDLLDEVIKTLKPENIIKQEEINPIRVAIIGRPNVGKSTLFNALIGEERAIVSPAPLTTRESHDTLILRNNEPFLFVDTAGLRRQSRIQEEIEKRGAGQAVQSLEKADLALLVLDATEPFSFQEKHLADLVYQKKKGLIIVINKWDLLKEQGEKAREYFVKAAPYYFPFLAFAPLAFISAKTHWRVAKIFDLIKEINASRRQVIGEKELEEFLKKTVKRHLPTKDKGVRHPKIYSLKQIDTAPPVFQLAVKQKTSLHQSYLKFIENRLRQEFGFIGTPLVIYAKKVKI